MKRYVEMMREQSPKLTRAFFETKRYARLGGNDDPFLAVIPRGPEETPDEPPFWVQSQHPAEVAYLYTEHLRHPTVVEQIAPDMMERLSQFCIDLDWGGKQSPQASARLRDGLRRALARTTAAATWQPLVFPVRFPGAWRSAT